MNKSTRYIIIVLLILIVSVVGILRVQHETGELEKFQDSTDILQYENHQKKLMNNTVAKALYDHEKSMENLHEQNQLLQGAPTDYQGKVSTFDTSVSTLHDISTPASNAKVLKPDSDNINRMGSEMRKKVNEAAYKIQEQKRDLHEDNKQSVRNRMNDSSYYDTVNAGYNTVVANGENTAESTLKNNPGFQAGIQQAYVENINNTKKVFSHPFIVSLMNQMVVNPYINTTITEEINSLPNTGIPTNGSMIYIYRITDVNKEVATYKTNNINLVASNENDTLFTYRIVNTPMTQKSPASRYMIAFEGYIKVPSDVSSIRIQVCSSFLKYVAWGLNDTRTIQDSYLQRNPNGMNPFSEMSLNNDSPDALCYTSNHISVKTGDRIYYRFVMLQRRKDEPNIFGYKGNSDFFLVAWAKNGQSFNEIDANALFISDRKDMKNLRYRR